MYVCISIVCCFNPVPSSTNRYAIDTKMMTGDARAEVWGSGTGYLFDIILFVLLVVEVCMCV